MIYRKITSNILAALEDTPVILINGTRQSGKTTLVRWLSKEKYPADYITLDNAAMLAAAQEAPEDFINNLKLPVIIDEIQRAPELFLAIKSVVDHDRKPGQFLLTGSANVMLLPKLAESLAGRMEIITLWPLSQDEIDRKGGNFIDIIFQSQWSIPEISPIEIKDLWERVLKGGFPENLNRRTQSRRNAWFGSYITTILQRDIRDLANIEGLTALPNLLKLLSARIATLLNFSELSRTIKIPKTTLIRYMTLLETTFLFHELPSWSSNLSKRLVKSPKIILSDTGLISFLQNLKLQGLVKNAEFGGRILENFVVMELIKQSAWCESWPSIYHFRTQNGHEVDILIEDGNGNVVGVEVKLNSTVKGSDFRGIKILAESLENKFIRGMVFYTGEKTIAFGKNLFAIPISGIWQIS